MKSRIKFGVIALAVALGAGIAFAGFPGDRLKIPVLIGQGTAVIEKLVFDLGLGSSNPLIQSTSGGVLQLTNDQTNLMTLPSATDTIVGKATTDVFTNKTLTSTSNVYRAASVSQDGAVTTGTQSFLGVKDFTSGVNDGFTVTGSHATGAGTRMSVFNTSTSQTLLFDSGSGNQSPLIATTADDLVFKINSATRLTVLAGGGITIANAGGNTPHACTNRTNAGTSVEATVTCSAGEIAVGGGGSCAGINDAVVGYSRGFASNTWTFRCANSGGTVTAMAVCCSI